MKRPQNGSDYKEENDNKHLLEKASPKSPQKPSSSSFSSSSFKQRFQKLGCTRTDVARPNQQRPDKLFSSLRLGFNQ
jgi:hypothetical protein